MRFFLFLVASLSLVSTFSSTGFTDDATSKPATKAKVWVSNSAHQVRVKVDPSKNGIAVTMNKGKDQIPKSIGITFFDANGNSTAVELKTVEPPAEMPNAPSSQASYAGDLSPSAQSFVGFELRIPLGSDSPTIIHSDDLKRTD